MGDERRGRSIRGGFIKGRRVGYDDDDDDDDGGDDWGDDVDAR